MFTSAQFGFRKDKNMYFLYFLNKVALYFLNKNINDSINHNNHCLLELLDLAKAFDAVYRNKLIEKLKLIGCRSKTLNWVQRYFSNRKQVVAIARTLSDPCTVDYGVIQGSTLALYCY